MSEIYHRDESYKIIGCCFEVHKTLGVGFLEAVYKDALELEFINHGLPFAREVEFLVTYKGELLRHRYYADFTAYDKIIVEVKSTKDFNDVFIAKCINYLKVSGYKLAILVNFGTAEMQFKRVVL